MTTTERNTEPQAEPESDDQQRKFDLDSCSKAELIEIIHELGAEVKMLREGGDLRDRDEATLANIKPWALNPAGFARGKLPGGKLIATDRDSGAYFPVELDEWLNIPAK